MPFRAMSNNLCCFCRFTSMFLLLCWLPITSALGFSPAMHEVELLEVTEDQRKSVDSGALFELVQAALPQYELEIVIRLDTSLCRYLAIDREEHWPDKEIKELELGFSADDYSSQPVSIDHSFSKHPLYLAIAEPVEDDPLTLSGESFITLLIDELNTVTLVDSTDFEYQFWHGLYLCDLTGNGRLDLAVQSTSGTSRGGSVALRTILPDGTFGNSKVYSPDPKFDGKSFIYSGFGACSLIDIDKDGDIEIEVMEWFNWLGEDSIRYNLLYTFDSSEQRWIRCTDKYPEEFIEQREFFEAYRRAFDQIKADPESLKKLNGSVPPPYYCIDFKGNEYVVDLAEWNLASVEALLRSFDHPT